MRKYAHERTRLSASFAAQLRRSTLVFCLFSLAAYALTTHVLFEFETRRHWRLATVAFLGVVAVNGIYWRWRLSQWFDRNVSSPLHTLMAGPPPPGRRSREPQTASPVPVTPHMDEPLAVEEFECIRQSWLRYQTLARRIAVEARRRIAEKEEGFGRQLRRAEDLAMVDPLTGLRNRAFLARELEDILSRHRQRGEDLAVVMLDVDNFKAHNDTHGHDAGDELLKFVGDLLRGSIRSDDYAVRYGGDEFMLLLSNANRERAREIVERMVKLFAQFAATKGGEPAPSLSAGVATLKESPQCDGAGLLRKSDMALYAAKRAGKNTVTWTMAQEMAAPAA